MREGGGGRRRENGVKTPGRKERLGGRGGARARMIDVVATHRPWRSGWQAISGQRMEGEGGEGRKFDRKEGRKHLPCAGKPLVTANLYFVDKTEG